MKKRVFGRKTSRNIPNIAVYAMVFCIVALSITFFLYDLPPIEDFETPIPKISVTLESYDGEKIAIYNIERKYQLDEVPKNIINAVVSAISDNLEKNFFSRNKTNIKYVLHQITRIFFPLKTSSIKRKVQEYILCKKLENKFTKKKLLKMYLSKAYFGFGIFGICDAAQFFFKKNISQLNLYESAKLAAILFNGYSNSGVQVVKNILSIMKEANHISEDEFNDAILFSERLNDNIPTQYSDFNKNFSDFVIDQAEKIVNFWKQGNIVIKTTLDTRLQKNASEIINRFIKENGIINRISQVALVSIDKVGAIRAMIGGIPSENFLINRTLTKKPLGSLVNFFIYSSAIDSGINIYDSIDAPPITIDAHVYKIPDTIEKLSLINAYVNSIEIYSIRLAEKIGLKNIKNFGIQGLAIKDISAVLGTDEVSLLDVSSCFGSVINDGKKINPFGIISIKNSRGEELYRARKVSSRNIISHDCSEKMKMLLKEYVINKTDAAIPGLECLGQSGLSHDDRNASFIGIVDPLITGVWIGNDNNIPMINNNSDMPIKIWKEFVVRAFQKMQRKKLSDLLKQTTNDNFR